jgi:hypothetical protein
MPKTDHSDPDSETVPPRLTSSKALPAPPKMASPAGTKAGSEVTLVTATPAQTQLTVSLGRSWNADGTPKTNMPSAARGAMVEAIPIEVVGAFDYASLPAETAGNLQSCAARIRKQVTDMAHSIILIGHFLTLAKQVLAHGQFIRWVVAECGFSVSSAENYIRVCEFTAHDGRFATVTILPPATLYLISAKNAPHEIVQAVVARAASGVPVPAAEVKRMLREFKARNRKETQGKGRRGQAKNEIAHANAQAILKRFGRDGAVFLLGIRDDIAETLTVLEQELGTPGGPDQRAAA